jgi:hypothetical protein
MNERQKFDLYPTEHSKAIGVENQVNGNERLRGIDNENEHPAGIYNKTFKNSDGTYIRESATQETKNMQITKQKLIKP